MGTGDYRAALKELEAAITVDPNTVDDGLR